MTIFRVFTAAFLLVMAQPIYADEITSSHLRTVEDFIAAFNVQDSRAMAAYVAEDFEWLSIEGDKIALESLGRNSLIASMDAYFSSCPSCQSVLLEAISTPGRISAIEVASWQGEAGPRSQRAISVYEFSDGLIQRVYYFPAEK